MLKTVKAKMLLGWMPRDEALQFLLEKCVFEPALTEHDAVQCWDKYRARVTALPKRTCARPEFLKLNKRERTAVHDFRKSPKRFADTIHDVVKIDPRKLVIHQFYVVTERSEEYAKRMHNDKQRIKLSLGLDTQAVETVQNGTTTTVRLPHWEYDLNASAGPNGSNILNIVEWPRFISVADRGDRLLLWGGYHRTYAFLSHTEPDGPDEPPLVTLITSPSVEAFFSDASSRPEVRESVRGDCPALFEDFFNPDLSMEVSFRKQRREVRVDSVLKTVWHGFIDDDS